MQATYEMATLSAEPAEKILVVDDDPGIRDVVSEFLQRHGYHVETAADGKEMDRSPRPQRRRPSGAGRDAAG